MAAPLVLVTWPDFPKNTAARLRAAGLRLRRAPKHGARSPHELVELARGCAAAIVSTDPFTADVLGALPGLRLIARVGVGVDSIDLAAASARGVRVTAARGTNEHAVADYTLGAMLAVLRRIAAHDAAVRRGEWERTGERVGADLHGKTVGLVGLGRVGSLVARRLAGFDVAVVAYDPAGGGVAGVRRVTLDDLLRAADVVSIHAPLTPATRNLIDARAIAAMKAGAVLVNAARGGIVDERALAAALAEGRLGGAALDVFEREPPDGSPLLSLAERTLLTPHIAGLSGEAIAAMVEHAAAAVLAWAQGRRPDGVVNPPLALEAANGG
jgi:phosphoglycerate dehydrogenase-like enzyme